MKIFENIFCDFFAALSLNSTNQQKMKKGLFSVLLLVTMSLNFAMGTQTQVPVKVQDTFTKLYPKASFLEWQLDDDVYVVNFKVGEVDKEATFEKTGKWTETRTMYTADFLSQMAKDAISKKFPECQLEEVILVEKPKAKRIEVWIETKAKETMTVVLNDKDEITDSY